MKKYFFTGLVILLPAALTLMLLIYLFDFFTEPLVPLIDPLVVQLYKQLPFLMPYALGAFVARLISLITLCVMIVTLGFLTQVFLLNRLVQWFHLLMDKIPFVKTVYRASRDVFSALFSLDGKRAFQDTVMIPFPYVPHYSLGFSAGEAPIEVQKALSEPFTSVFIPTAPHPISGYLAFVPSSKVSRPELSSEDLIKFVVSCGTIVPKAELEESDDGF